MANVLSNVKLDTIIANLVQLHTDLTGGLQVQATISTAYAPAVDNDDISPNVNRQTDLAMIYGYSPANSYWQRIYTDDAHHLIVSAEQNGVWDITVTSTVLPTGAATDSTLSTFSGKFPSAQVLADGLANPTVSEIASFLMGFNGTTWDRIRDASALDNATLSGTLKSYNDSGTGIQPVLLLGYDPTSLANAYRAIQVTSTGLIKVATP